jgi:hypothetical protein
MAAPPRAGAVCGALRRLRHAARSARGTTMVKDDGDRERLGPGSRRAARRSCPQAARPRRGGSAGAAGQPSGLGAGGTNAPAQAVRGGEALDSQTLSFVRQGRIGPRVAKSLSHCRSRRDPVPTARVPHALWNPTDEPAVTVAFISRGSARTLLRRSRAGEAQAATLSRADLIARSPIATTVRVTRTHPDLVNRSGVRPRAPWTVGVRVSRADV